MFSEIGREAEARVKYKEEQSQLGAYDKALCFLALGDLDGAFKYLEKARIDNSTRLYFLKVDPHFDEIRSDNRFIDLEGRMNFPKENKTD